jgi:hypothetical protein
MLTVHYHKVTGEIVKWGTGDSDVAHSPDHAIARLDASTTPPVNPKRHRIDVASGKLVNLSAAEAALANLPTLLEVNAAIGRELHLTDQYMVPDRPVLNRQAWIEYRQALRDLSKLAGTPAMIAGWPLRHDGQDAIAHLRARLPKVTP